MERTLPSKILGGSQQKKGMTHMTAIDFACAINLSPWQTIASDPSGTNDIGSIDGSRIIISGANAISSFGAEPNQTRIVKFAGILTLHHSASLFLVSQADRATSAGAIGGYASDDDGNWSELFYSSPETSFPSGTAMLFQQSTAPTGWTKQTTHNDKALRVVSGSVGSGGATGFSSVFGASKVTGDFTISLNELPSDHKFLSAFADNHISGADVAGGADIASVVRDLGSSGTPTALPAGGGHAHHHTLSLDLAYVDIIVATKD